VEYIGTTVAYSERGNISFARWNEDAAMTSERKAAVEVLRTVWSAEGTTTDDLDEALPPPAKACKNMRDISFDGMAEPGSDLREAWRDRLEREGKLNRTGGSIRDLVLGTDAPR
jgi:hypothetical protein